MKLKFLLVVMILISILTNCKGKNPSQEINIDSTETQWLQPFLNDYNNYIDSSLKSINAPGAALTIVYKNNRVLTKCFGVKQIASNDSVNEHTLFRIGSVSKTFAGTLCGILVQQKIFNWEDSILKHIPTFQLKNKSESSLKIKHFASHTTGLPIHSFTNHIEEGLDYEKLRSKLKEVDVAGNAGSFYAYQNVAFSVLGEVAEKTTHCKYDSLLKKYIFSPLHMNDAGCSFQQITEISNIAHPHILKSGQYQPTNNTKEYYNYLPAAGINASIDDMSRYLYAMMGNTEQVFNKHLLNDILQPEIETPNYLRRWKKVKKMYYAKGWRVIHTVNDTIYYHSGYVKGYKSDMAFSSKYQIGMVILFNFTGKITHEALPQFFDMYEGYIQSKDSPVELNN